MTEKMPSSVSDGSRPRAVTMRSYSSGVRPGAWRIAGGSIDGSGLPGALRSRGPGGAMRGERRQDRLEQHEAVCAPEGGFAGALRVRHEANDIAAVAADARDVVDRAVR